ncbi:flagellar hook-basal body complex protein [Clostridium haemolyticum]|uniref:Flagellar hook protein FlgE n=1 Tax=Clostridium haemolyticum NCTC 9693 TaxID=1443114 RepID=A0ABR4TDJ2_CLOHA|nr:flagellar hook-basal body complex protein [Clostridium haemolyticum]KEI16183.1 flagellar hook protein FlgE [Clostridium haemolyticum NCTC 9693]KGN03751.1 flagellar hook protein FlgE [Clostridium haemolyticum NCTC 8350]
MLRSMYAGISGMKVNQTKLDVTGNNIANVSTTAFKSSRVRFQDMLSQNVQEAVGPGKNLGGVNGRQVGLGVSVAGIDTVVSQGMLQPTSRNLDVAIDGTGYLIVARGKLDGDDSEALKGIKVDENFIGGKPGNIPNDQSEFQISYTRDGAFALDYEGNLLTSDGYRVMGYAIKGATIDYKKGEPIKFKNAEDDDLEAEGGKLVPLKIPELVGESKDNAKKIRSFSIEKNGLIKGVLDDGSVAALGQIAMASFKNPEGLKKEGKNMYSNTANSGQPIARSAIKKLGGAGDKDNSEAYGDMVQGMLEMSNVDLAEQFTDMIVTTRAFQASGKMISTGDEILQDIINLKR